MYINNNTQWKCLGSDIYMQRVIDLSSGPALQLASLTVGSDLRIGLTTGLAVSPFTRVRVALAPSSPLVLSTAVGQEQPTNGVTVMQFTFVADPANVIIAAFLTHAFEDQQNLRDIRLSAGRNQISVLISDPDQLVETFLEEAGLGIGIIYGSSVTFPFLNALNADSTPVLLG